MEHHSKRPIRFLTLFAALIVAAEAGSMQHVSAGSHSFAGPTAELLVGGLEGGSGSTIGPGGDLYVAEAHAGRISRVDPRSGRVTTFASGLPKRMPGFPFGGVIDVAFIGKTAYALVSLVGPDVGGSDTVGIYRVDGRSRFTVVADIGAFSIANPPTIPFEFFVPTGVPYTLEPFQGGFLVTDGHLNRVLKVGLDGNVAEVIGFGNVVPTGLAVSRNQVYLGMAGPVPHSPQDGRVLLLRPRLPRVTQVASGIRLVVDVEHGRGHVLYALSQGTFPVGEPDGSPALPNTGALVEVRRNGTLKVVVDGLNQPTSLEFLGDTAYVVTYGGEIWRIDGVSGPHFSASH